MPDPISSLLWTLRVCAILLFAARSLPSPVCDTPDCQNDGDGKIPLGEGSEDDSKELEPFWEQLNAGRNEAMDRARFKFLDSLQAPAHHRVLSSVVHVPLPVTDNDNATNTESTPEEFECGALAIQPRFNTRIVGGREARPHSWSFICSLQRFMGGIDEPWIHICGATIIGRRCILTAAHCVKAKASDPTQYRIVVGEHNLREAEGTESVYSIDSVTVHERYGEEDAGYDIALLKLSSDVKYSDAVRPICLPDSPPPEWTNSAAIGWGDTQGTGNDNVLNEVEVPVLPNSLCGQRAWYGHRIKDDMMCAGYEAGGQDSCSGDSGGPLVRQPGLGRPWQLAGVTSWGILCALRRKPGVYTRVHLYTDWIRQHCSELA